MKTFKLGYQAPLKDTCAECELYNLQIRTAPPALKVVMLHPCDPPFSLLFVSSVPLFVAHFQAKLRHQQARIYDWPARDTTETSTMVSTACRPGVQRN